MEDMRGQGKGKKIKVDSSLTGGGEREENDGGSTADILPGNAQHPLLTELVMEVLFKQFSLLNHDDSPKSALAHLAELRLVCKTWNQEIGKIIRKETHINVNKLISAYPKGLGWAPTTITAEEPNNMAFTYSAPMPEAFGTFQNLSVTIKACDDLTNTSMLKWFQVMGSSVKSLSLTCSLNCPHQNRFVEKILKEWCPNLKSFTLQEVCRLESLIQNSLFAEPSLVNQGRTLKEFILSIDGILQREQWSEICDLRIEALETPRGVQQLHDLRVRLEIHDNRSTFVRHLINYLDQAGEAATSVAQEEDLLNKLVRRPIGLTSLYGMSPRTFGSHVADFFQEKFSSDPGNENDGGIIGQLMKMSSVERFVIQKANEKQEWFFNELFAMFFYRPNLWRSSLQDFECLGHCPAVTAVYNNRNNPMHMPPKNIFSKVGFPLKRLNFDRGFLLSNEKFQPQSLEKILSGCAETLEELEFGLGAHGFYQRVVTLPFLPSLKMLAVDCKDSGVVKLTSQDILGKLPKVENCRLALGKETYGAPNSIFEYDNSWDDDAFWRDDVGSHPLKELKLLDEYVDERDIERMVMCFPNLKIVDLSIRKESGEDFKAFWEKMGELPLEQIKISFSVKSRRDKDYDLYENAIRDNIVGFKDLQWLELVHEGLHRFPLTSRLAKGFAKATKLRVLKFTNFQVDGKVAEEIKKSLPNAVVQLPAIRSSEARRMKRKL